MRNYFLNIALLLITIAITACSDESSKQNVKTSVMIKVSEFCETAGNEAQMAVAARDTGLSLEDSLKKIDIRHNGDQDMLSYAKKIWTGVYGDRETFNLDNSEQIVRDLCFTKLIEYASTKEGVDLVAYACKNKAEQTKQMAILRDNGISYGDFKSKIMKVTEKGDSTLKTYGMEEKGKQVMLNALDYVYSNNKRTASELYQNYLSECITKNKKSNGH